MITYKKEMVEQQLIDKVICDRCKQEVVDVMEIQEMCGIRFVGGYSSVFGDMCSVSCDLCQQCLKDLIGDFCVYEEE